ncbi:MAG: hypothetical protein L3K13_00760 [Thermoplasmata archaeon]|nr:hypothetical protein [Thermoplasmata archaeon]
MLAFLGTGHHRAAAEWLRVGGEVDGKFAQRETLQPSLNLNDAYTRLGMPPPRGRLVVAPTKVPEGWRTVPR